MLNKKLSTKKIGVVGCKHTTRDLIAGLIRKNIKIDHCITIGPELARKAEVAGYLDLRPFLEERNISYTVANSYSLSHEEDRSIFKKIGIDCLLVMGWQRLIPDYCLASLSIGAFGMHGSSKHLPQGRGRSPINWSIIQGKETFFTHLFRYLPGVDDGPIVGIQQFEITAHDDCLTLHYKNLVSMTKLCAEHLPSLLSEAASLTPQPDGVATYYPKRTEKDGVIFWQNSTTDIFRLVRAVTRPFPGAFSFLDNDSDKKVRIWSAQPFDKYLSWQGSKPGQILEVFYDGSFVVKTGDSSMLVTVYDPCRFSEKDIGRILGSISIEQKTWENVPL